MVVLGTQNQKKRGAICQDYCCADNAVAHVEMRLASSTYIDISLRYRTTNTCMACRNSIDTSRGMRATSTRPHSARAFKQVKWNTTFMADPLPVSRSLEHPHRCCSCPFLVLFRGAAKFRGVRRRVDWNCQRGERLETKTGAVVMMVFYVLGDKTPLFGNNVKYGILPVATVPAYSSRV